MKPEDFEFENGEEAYKKLSKFEELTKLSHFVDERVGLAGDIMVLSILLNHITHAKEKYTDEKVSLAIGMIQQFTEITKDFLKEIEGE